MGMHRYKIYGLGFVVILAGIVALAGALSVQAFRSVVPVTVQTERSGLLLEPGNDVKMRGVVVGEVTEIAVEQEQVVVSLGLDPSTLARIPANVTAQLAPTTAFGPKFVQFDPPENPAPTHIQAGEVVEVTDVAIEVNEVLENLNSLLRSVQPAQLNATLGVLATSLEGRGDDLGRFLVDLDRYLQQFNPSVSTLQDDLAMLPSVVDSYADLSPDLIEILDNLTLTGNTLVEKKGALDAVLRDFTRFGRTGQQFIAKNDAALVRTLELLVPTTDLLERYSPVIPCFLGGMNNLRRMAEAALGGTNPSLRLEVSPRYGQEPYSYPEDLPVVGADSGPDCHGMPVISEAKMPVPRVDVDDGTDPFPTSDETPQLSDRPLPELLFGRLAGQLEAGR